MSPAMALSLDQTDIDLVFLRLIWHVSGEVWLIFAIDDSFCYNYNFNLLRY